MGDAIKNLRRNLDIRRLASPRQYVRERLAENAEALSLAGVAAARVELLNEALCKLVGALYELDADGSPANVDVITMRIRIPAPWGSTGGRLWGLRHWESECLSRILRNRQASWAKGQRPPLFCYDDAARSWHLNLADYGSLQAASYWLKHSAITIAEFNKEASTYRQRRVKVVSAHKQRVIKASSR